MPNMAVFSRAARPDATSGVRDFSPPADPVKRRIDAARRVNEGHPAVLDFQARRVCRVLG